MAVGRKQNIIIDFDNLLVLTLEGKRVCVLTDPLAEGVRQAIYNRQKTRFVLENWDFLNALYRLSENKKITPEKLKTELNHIITTYIRSDANTPINIKSTLRDDILEKAKDSITIFDFYQALIEVAGLVRENRQLASETVVELDQNLTAIYKESLVTAGKYILTKLHDLYDRAPESPTCAFWSRENKLNRCITKASDSLSSILDKANLFLLEEFDRLLSDVIATNQKNLHAIAVLMNKDVEAELKKLIEKVGAITLKDAAKVDGAYAMGFIRVREYGGQQSQHMK